MRISAKSRSDIKAPAMRIRCASGGSAAAPASRELATSSHWRLPIETVALDWTLPAPPPEVEAGAFGAMQGTAEEIEDIVAPLPAEDWEALR